MKITYDASADAAYIYLTEIAPGGVARTIPLDPVDSGHMINLDFDSKMRLLGIEVMDASRVLTADVLAAPDIERLT